MTGVIKYDSALVPKPQGLANHGNTCWANSVLQFLVGIPALTRVLVDYEHEFNKNRFARCYLAFVQAQIAGTAASTEQIIDAMYTGLAAIGSGFDKPPGHQQCAFEAFTHIIELFNSSRVSHIFETAYKNVAECPSCGANPAVKHDVNLSVKLTADGPPLTCETDFTNFIRVQPDSPGGYRCDKCAKISDDWKWRKWLCRTGPVIVVSFHFKPTSRGERYYPATLRFLGSNNAVMTYRLVGIIEHHGCEYLGQSSGHYTARSYRSGWWSLNDSNVSSAGPQPTADTFMVAYHVVG